MVSDGNSRMRPMTVTVAILTTLVGLGVAAVFVISMATASDQTDHEKSAKPHPVIQTTVDAMAKNVGEIDDKVDTLMTMQAVQTAILEGIEQDIGELK